MMYLFPAGVLGVIAGVFLLLLCYIVSRRKIREGTWAFGSFEAGMTSYLRVVEIIIGLATASIVLLGNSSAIRVNGRLPGRYGSPLVLLAMSVIYLVLFIGMLVYTYEQAKHKRESFTHRKYRLLHVLVFPVYSVLR
jgi:hypothetical protein